MYIHFLYVKKESKKELNQAIMFDLSLLSQEKRKMYKKKNQLTPEIIKFLM